MSQQQPGRSKSRAATLLVVAAFCILLAYVLLVDARRAPAPDPEATPTPWPILGWQMDDLQSIHVTDGSVTTRLDFVDGEWRVTESAEATGQSAPADPRTIYLPMLELSALEARLLVYNQVTDKAAYGLDAPTLTISVETRSGEKARLYAGRETPDGTAFYLQRDGDPRLYIVDHYKIELFQEWLSAPPFKATPAADG